MKLSKISVINITLFVLFLSLIIFPMLGTGHGWHGIGLNSFIITCVFVSVWLIMLILAAIIKSKALINVYLCYWSAITLICTFCALVATFDRIAVLEGVAVYLFLLFLTPTIGIAYLFPNSLSVLPMFIPILGMFLLGLFVKWRFIKASYGKQ